MKTFYLKQFKTASAALILLLCEACTVTPGAWKNDKISSGKRDDFHKLNDEVLGYLKAKDEKGLKVLFSRELIAANTSRVTEIIGNYLNDKTYYLLDEFYLVHKYTDADTVPVKSGDMNRYALIYPNDAREMYAAYFIPKNTDNKQMISIIYAKLDYGWRVEDLKIQPYTINGKTGPELYHLAREEYDKKELQAAYDNASLAINCFDPGIYWAYPEKEEATHFYGKLNDEVNKVFYSHPLVLKQLATGPMILRVYTKTMDDGTYPMIYYMTHYPIEDTVKIKSENMQMREVIKKIMPGLSDNNTYILYSAFNKQPTGYNTVEHFDMTEKVY